MGSCPRVRNRCTFGLANQQAGSYSPATELEIIRFRNFPFGDLMWHLITQVNGSILDAYITVFEPIMGNCRRSISFLVYTPVYPSISINLVTLATLSPWSHYVRTHTPALPS